MDDPGRRFASIEDAIYWADHKDKVFRVFNADHLVFVPAGLRVATSVSEGFFSKNALVPDTNLSLNFIRDRRAYHLIGSNQIQKINYNFGHHGTFVFPELKLGTTHQADYLIIGRNSDGYHFVFVELESPYGKITIGDGDGDGDGDEGEVIRKGLNQIDDWERWLDGNYASIAETLEKYKHPQIDFPREFYKLDKTRVKYVIVTGRRDDFSEKLRWKKRKLQEDKRKISIDRVCKIELSSSDAE